MKPDVLSLQIFPVAGFPFPEANNLASSTATDDGEVEPCEVAEADDELRAHPDGPKLPGQERALVAEDPALAAGSAARKGVIASPRISASSRLVR